MFLLDLEKAIDTVKWLGVDVLTVQWFRTLDPINFNW